MKRLIISLLVIISSISMMGQSVNSFLNQTGEDLVGILEDTGYEVGSEIHLKDSLRLRICYGDLYGYPVKLEIKYRIFPVDIKLEFLITSGIDSMVAAYDRIHEDLMSEHSYCLGIILSEMGQEILFFDDYTSYICFSPGGLSFRYLSYGEKNRITDLLGE